MQTGQNRLVQFVMAGARKHLDKIPEAISGQGGHDRTFATACALMSGFMLDFSEAMVLMQEYNSRCKPPWSQAELEHKLRDAAEMDHRFGIHGIVDSTIYQQEFSSM